MLIVMMMIMQPQLQMLMTRLMTLLAIEADQVQKLSTWQQTAPTGHLADSHYHPRHDVVYGDVIHVDNDDNDLDDQHGYDDDNADDYADDVESSTVR